MDKEIKSDKELLEERKAKLETELSRIDQEPEAVKQEKISEIDFHISRVAQRTKPQKPGNKTMYQHLLDVRQEWEQDSERLLLERKQSLEKMKDHWDDEIKRVEEKELETKER